MLAIRERDHVTVVKGNVHDVFDLTHSRDVEDLRAVVSNAFDLIISNPEEVIDVSACVVLPSIPNR